MTPRLIGVGAIFIDDIVLPDGRTYMGQLGGGVVHALMGAALWDEKPGIVALAGRDLEEAVRQYLSKHFDMRGLHDLDLPQMRAWQIFETDGTRRELYRVQQTEPFVRGAQPEHLPEAYRPCRGCYLLQGFEGIRVWRQTLDRAFILWEPLQQIMTRANCANLLTILQNERIDLISPNLAEAQAILGLPEPEALIAALLENGARAVALRMGPEGSLIGDQNSQDYVHIPAIDVRTVVDQTGAGNTYCGALLAGMTRGKSLHEAAVMGAVAASFCIEQQGVLKPDNVQKQERDNRYNHAIS